MAKEQKIRLNQLMEMMFNIPNANKRILTQGTAQQIHWLLLFCKNTEGEAIQSFNSFIPVSWSLFKHPVIRNVSRKSLYVLNSLMACWRSSISFFLSKGWRNQWLKVSFPRGVEVRFNIWKTEESPNTSRSKLKRMRCIHPFLSSVECTIVIL